MIAYTALWLFQYSTDLLGRYPVLDARENLQWAERIATGTLPSEPFYRALLYPWVLSLLGGVPWAASLLGILLHGANAVLVGRISVCLWAGTRAGWLSSGLYSIYPPALYFSVQLLDITLGITLFLASLLCFLLIEKRGTMMGIVSGLLIGLATLTRPSFYERNRPLDGG